MGRIIKNLKPYWKTIVIIVLLLILQAVCDLALPQYTSDIIDTGIQNSGVKHIIPEAIVASEYEKAQLFMTTQEKEQWTSLYQQDNDIYRCKEKSEKKLDEYDSLLVLPLLIVGQMEEADATQMQQFSMMGSMPDEVIQQVRENTQKTIDTMGESFVHAMGVSYAVKQDILAGLDIHSIQTRYLLIAGGKMVVMALLIAVTTVLVGLAASKVAAGIGRDMRVSVYKNVMSFSNAEMDKFSTASLITRTTNDIQQIQMVTVLSLRMVAYAPILGIGGIIKVMNTNSGMEWVIAVAVASIMCLVLLLMMIAMPKFKQMQKLVDAVNLVSREILTGLSVIRAFGREKKEEERFDNANKNLTKTMLFTNRVMTFMMPAMTLIMYGINVLIIWVAAHRIDEGVMQVGSMTAFITYTMQIVMSFLMLTMMSIFMPRAIVSANRIDEVLNIVDLEDTGKKRAGQFSMGMKQRLGIAIALLNSPNLLILDEPTNGLDPIGIQELRNLIKSFPQKGITVILSSHMLSEVQVTADYIGIIAGGVLGYEGALQRQENLESLFMSIVEKNERR